MMSNSAPYECVDSQSVVIDGINSKPSSCSLGVPQGMVLAPPLSLIFINDIVQDIHCTVKLYADNILKYATINTPEDCLLLQSNLALFQAWANKWPMEFKCLPSHNL